MSDFGKRVAIETKKSASKAAPSAELASLSTLTADPRNANRGTERGREMLKDSLHRLQAGRSILVDKYGVVIAGNKTRESAQSLGMDDAIVVKSDGSKIVVVQRTDLDLSTDAIAKELAIADNRISEESLDWDADVLKSLGEEIDLSAMFSDAELEAIIEANTPPVELLTDEDEVPPAPRKAISKLGEVYVLGNHRLMCGDSTSGADVLKLMNGKLADCVWTDPPYNIAYTGKTKESLTIQNDAMSAEKFRSFLHAVFANMLNFSREGAGIYIAHADTEGYNFRGAMVDAGWSFRQCLVWVKNTLVMGRSDYHWMHEPILYGWKPGAAHGWHSDRKQTTVLNFDRPTRSTEHPTMKPVALVEYCLGNSSAKGDNVLDLFGGSGTTLIACEKLGRNAFLMELDPIYCDVIRTRWEQATGQKVVVYGPEA